MNAGEPMFTMAPKEPFCADVRALAGALLGGQQKIEASKGGALSRLFG